MCLPVECSGFFRIHVGCVKSRRSQSPQCQRASSPVAPSSLCFLSPADLALALWPLLSICPSTICICPCSWFIWRDHLSCCWCPFICLRSRAQTLLFRVSLESCLFELWLSGSLPSWLSLRGKHAFWQWERTLTSRLQSSRKFANYAFHHFAKGFDSIAF